MTGNAKNSAMHVRTLGEGSSREQDYGAGIRRWNASFNYFQLIKSEFSRSELVIAQFAPIIAPEWPKWEFLSHLYAVSS